VATPPGNDLSIASYEPGRAARLESPVKTGGVVEIGVKSVEISLKHKTLFCDIII
jgi:hypothetical protein